MEKEQFQLRVMDYLSGIMDEEQQLAFENFLKAHPERMEQFRETRDAWELMDGIGVPEPSKKMDEGFYGMLQQQKDKLEVGRHKATSVLWNILQGFWRPQLAYAILILGVGITAGYYLNSSNEKVLPVTDFTENSETEAIREKLVLTLLEQPSANKRLQGVNEANKIENVDEKVIRALLQTLNHDPNVNVRLAAIESLTNYIDEPLVRLGLVASIVQQDAPIVQVTLANLMVALQEKESVASFKKLLEAKNIDSGVKKKLENSIRQII